ncbi:MAG: enoyl-CoA hydratase/isomerase family protein [Deltaproteobacteria bacterium]|nr:enoyl-CoA hydratase/isomerase family protein [Deltaproteobacteria bacterium]MBW2167327.1 enoyl-CoA hydratase/isomerase family protein [Deltaproteobacteria bacterium]
MTERSHSVLISERKENFVYLTLNRPDVLNALNKSLLLEIKKELETIKSNPKIQAVIITGAGYKAFSAGADIEYLNQASPLQVRELAQLAVSVTHLIENLNKISIALINGFALGGGLELAESCMLRVAVTSAKLGHPEVRIGAVAGWGGTTRLPRLIGKSRAAEMLLTGKMIDANKALQMGLVNCVTEPENLRNEGEKLLLEILQNSPIAVNLTWDAVHRGLDLPIDESAKLGIDYFGLVATTEDFRDGTKAFLQKQKAKFHGR